MSTAEIARLKGVNEMEYESYINHLNNKYKNDAGRVDVHISGLKDFGAFLSGRGIFSLEDAGIFPESCRRNI